MNMVIRRTLFVLMCLLASSLYMYGQITVKTNVAMDAVAIPNLGVEVGLSKKLTLDVPMYYNPWKYSDSKMLKLAMLQPELRYWLCDKFNGHFFGAHLMGGAYHTTGIDLPFSPFDDLGSVLWRRYQLRLPVCVGTSLEPGSNHRHRLCLCAL